MQTNPTNRMAMFGSLATDLRLIAERQHPRVYYGALSSFAETIHGQPDGIANYQVVKESNESWRLKSTPTDQILGMASDKSALQSIDQASSPLTDCFARRTAMLAMAGYAIGMTTKEMFTLGEEPIGNKKGYLEKRGDLSDDEVLSRYALNIKRFCNSSDYVPPALTKEITNYLDDHKPYLEKMPNPQRIQQDENMAWNEVQQSKSKRFNYLPADFNQSNKASTDYFNKMFTLNSNDAGFDHYFGLRKEEIKKGTTHSTKFLEKAGVRFDLDLKNRPPKEIALIEKEVAVLEKIKNVIVAIDIKNNSAGLGSSEEAVAKKIKATKSLVKEYNKIRDERATLFDKPTDNILNRPGMKLSGFQAPKTDNDLDEALNVTMNVTAPAATSRRSGGFDKYMGVMDKDVKASAHSSGSPEKIADLVNKTHEQGKADVKSAPEPTEAEKPSCNKP